MESKILTVAVFILMFVWKPLDSSAQVTMSFCTCHNDELTYTGCANTFDASVCKGHLNVILLAVPGKTLDTYNVLYIIYKDTILVGTIYQHDLQPDWKYYARTIDFFQPGKYRVEVYDLDNYLYLQNNLGRLMGSGSVTINNE
jgi:hypothetical protein